MTPEQINDLIALVQQSTFVPGMTYEKRTGLLLALKEELNHQKKTSNN